MDQTKQILTNTGATYIKTLATIVMALFSTRVLMDTLGRSDFGLLNLFLSVVALTVVLNTTLASGLSRYLAVEIGAARPASANEVFSAAFWMHLVLGTLLFAIAIVVVVGLLGPVFLVPSSRLDSSIWSIATLLTAGLFSMVLVPYSAVLIAHQRLYELSGFGLVQSVLLFVWTLMLEHLSGDGLLLYCTGYAAISVVIGALQVVRCRTLFPEFRVTLHPRSVVTRVKELTSFSAWNIIGNLGVAGRDQGTAILLNLSFGPVANAAYGIASQVSAQVGQIAAAFISAVSPEMNTSHGREQRTRVREMAYRASKLSSALQCVILVPLLFEVDMVLTVWLGQSVPHAADFIRCIMITALIDRLTVGHMLAIQARGKIAAYQSSLGTILLLTLPLTYVAFQVTNNPSSLGLSFLSTVTIVLFGRLAWGRFLVSLSTKEWLGKVLIPVSLGVVFPCMALVAITWLIEPSLARVGLSFVMSVVLSCWSGWFLVLSSHERNSIRLLIGKHWSVQTRK